MFTLFVDKEVQGKKNKQVLHRVVCEKADIVTAGISPAKPECQMCFSS
jgi:hypothetical protein